MVTRALLAILCASATVSAQPDPSTLPLVTSSSLVSVGGFRVPTETTFGGRQLTVTGSTLLIANNANGVGAITIPEPVVSSTLSDLPLATLVATFVDPIALSSTRIPGAGLSGLLAYGGDLLGTYSVYYDATNAQRYGHFRVRRPLSTPNFLGWSSVWEPMRQGYVSGALSAIPSEWQTRLGGDVLTGQCCIPIVSRTSMGPAAFAITGSSIGQATVSAQPLIYYDGAHPTLGPWEGQNDRYGMGTLMGGHLIVPGTRTLLFFGRNGTSPACYGTGTPTQSLHGTDVGDGSTYCWDPTDGSKGTHAYPYQPYVWAYDLNDLAAVKAGSKQPWEVVPYAVWPLTFPIMDASGVIGGVTYDPFTKRILVAQMFADPGPYGREYLPIIRAFSVSSAAQTGTTYYVSLSGNDANPGTITLPFRTVKRAVRALAAGDTLYLRAGNYVDHIRHLDFTASGTASAPILIAAYPGEAVTMSNGGTDGILGFEGREFIEFQDIKFDGSGFNAGDNIYLANNNMTFRRGEITGAWKNGLLTFGSGHRLIDVKVHGNGRQPTAQYGPGHVGVYSVTDNLLIDGGEFYNNQCYGIRQVDSEPADRAMNGLITRVRAYRNGSGKGLNGASTCGSGGGGIVVGDTNNVVTNNLVYDNLIGIDITGLSGKRVEGAKVDNNVICRNVGYGIGHGLFAGANGSQITNNKLCLNGSDITSFNVTNAVVTNNQTTSVDLVPAGLPVPTPTPTPVPTPVPTPTPTPISCTVQSVGTYADRDAKLTVRCNTNGSPVILKGAVVTVPQK